jgi:hypothetical protein
MEGPSGINRVGLSLEYPAWDFAGLVIQPRNFEFESKRREVWMLRSDHLYAKEPVSLAR